MLLQMLVVVIYTLVSLVGSLSGAGAAAMDTDQAWEISSYLQRSEQRAALPGKLSFGLLPENRFVVEFDDIMGEAFADMTELTGYDCTEIASSWPDMFYHMRWLYKLFPWAFNAARDYVLEKADEYEASANWNMMAVCRYLGAAIGMPTKIRIVAIEDMHGPGQHEACLEMTYGDGSTRRIESKATYNATDGIFYQDGDGAVGIVGLGFNMNARHGWAYTAADPPMRALGYMKLYDDLLLKTSDMVHVDTVRLKFPYQGRDWMVQLWKGRYFITTGGEIGLYNKPTDRRVEFYDAATDEERILMSYRVIVDKDTENEQLFVDRPLTRSWWMTGFALRPTIYGPSRVTLETELVPTDAEMLSGLCAALDREGPAVGLTYELVDVDGYGQAIAIIW